MIEVFNAQDWEHWARLFTENSIFKHPAFSEPQKGVAVHNPGGLVHQWINMNTTAIPDLHFEIEYRFAVNDRVCIEGAFIGTHTEILQLPDGNTLPATNKRISLSARMVIKIKVDNIAEAYVYYDLFALRSQLGII